MSVFFFHDHATSRAKSFINIPFVVSFLCCTFPFLRAFCRGLCHFPLLLAEDFAHIKFNQILYHSVKRPFAEVIHSS